MANLRIVYSNAANRNLSISASTTSGSLAAANLLTDIKSEIWRSTGTSADITLTWTNLEVVKMVALPFASLTTSATMRVRGYTNTTDPEGSPLFDTTALACCPVGSNYEWGNFSSLSVNNYGFGGGKTAVLWFTGGSVRKIIVSLADSTNPNGYLEASRVVCGDYWESTYNADYGASMGAADLSKHERSDAGDLRTDRGPRYKTLTVDITLMPAADRDVVWKIMYGNGMTRPVFFSLIPQSTDASEEAIHQLYGKLARTAALRYQFINQFNTTLEIEEV